MSNLAPPGSAFVGTSFLLRYLMVDVPERLDQVRRIIDESAELLLTDGTLAEVAYVLTRVYQIRQLSDFKGYAKGSQ